MSDFKHDLEKMLRYVRITCGFTQHEVADILQINRSTYTYYETGVTSPDVETLRKLAILFSIPAETFLYPEKYASLDLKRLRVKNKKKPSPNPQRLGELTKEEKEVVMAFRTKDMSL